MIASSLSAADSPQGNDVAQAELSADKYGEKRIEAPAFTIEDIAVSTASVPTLHLNWDMKDGLVTVTPQDQDRFIIKVRRAIDILQQAAQAEQFERQFNLLLRILAEWLNEQTGVERAYLTHRDAALAFVVVRSACEYDDDFEDGLSDLDFRVANDPDLDLIKMDALALPLGSENAVSSFIDPGFVLEYLGHGNRGGSHCPGKQEP